jgi:signal transduction histidine kinase
MRLSEFINVQREQIMVEWEAFARTLGPATDAMDITALRDHASEMLSVIAADLETPQSDREQHAKSVGQGADEDTELLTAAQEHGADRAEHGFTIDQMVSEYRALRASVIRLWIAARGALTDSEVDELTRFNEAIDQALAESTARFTQDLEHSREMFIAILGHDLRTPLGSIVTSATFMLDLGELREPYLTLASRIASSSRRMDRMVGDLLDLTRSRLGRGISIERDSMNVGDAVREVTHELRATHADRTIEVSAAGDMSGRWDYGRISQVLANLIANALEHGAADSPVTIALQGRDDDVVITVHNHGEPIPESMRRRIFDPMKRRESDVAHGIGTSANLGLGLYIAERIMTAHKGTITVVSSADEGTTFTLCLPRDEPRGAADGTDRRTEHPPGAG